MPGQNYSTTSEFILFSFSAFPHQLLPALFLLYLLMYLFTLLGNLLIMATVWTERQLHTPMYLFLCALSISEILFTIAITPRMLADLLSTHHSITFVACAMQTFFCFTFGYAHSFLLMVMGYDRYVAICYPLSYNVFMSPTVCAHLVTWSWAGGSVMGMIMTSIVFHLTFCESHVIHCILFHEFSLLKLACGDEMGSVTIGVILVCVIPLVGCLSLIILSYVVIVSAILRIPSPEGRHEIFSTCVSHLTIVIVHYSFASMIYLKPKGPHSIYTNTLMSTIYIVFTPFLSPIIFSLRNKELKTSINKNYHRKLCLQNP
ncbi:olfactory receptor 10H28-like [Cavia porcellus]|uniref:G-protein coupled receptors family 1 profile domain-containing protein n=1 Tax=Cavia porcellus TaxID=10141 RepID=H0W7T6_CAVPO|nr:olfactory receptor 63-like [Cavia porcellus]